MTVTEITVELKNPPQVVFNEATPSVGNYVRFRVSPQVQIAIGARAKRPGEGMSGEPLELSVVDQQQTQGKTGGRLGHHARLIRAPPAGASTPFRRPAL